MKNEKIITVILVLISLITTASAITVEVEEFEFGYPNPNYGYEFDMPFINNWHVSSKYSEGRSGGTSPHGGTDFGTEQESKQLFALYNSVIVGIGTVATHYGGFYVVLQVKEGGIYKNLFYRYQHLRYNPADTGLAVDREFSKDEFIAESGKSGGPNHPNY